MSQYKISVDLADLAAIKDIINAEVFPLLKTAVTAVAFQTHANWQKAVYDAKLWSGEKDAYAQSITWRMTGDLSAIIEADYKNAEEIETGRPARDLKKMLDTSMKVRANKDGQRYLVIPFRHNVPGSASSGQSMPANVYAMAKAMEASKVTGHSKRVSGTGAYSTKTKSPYLVRQRHYQWGDSLPAGMASKQKPHHATDIYAGMRRFDTKGGSSKQHSTYLTFRVMSEASKGWIVPPQPGLYIARKVADDMQPLAEKAFQQAIKKTLG